MYIAECGHQAQDPRIPEALEPFNVMYWDLGHAQSVRPGHLELCILASPPLRPESWDGKGAEPQPAIRCRRFSPRSLDPTSALQGSSRSLLSPQTSAAQQWGRGRASCCPCMPPTRHPPHPACNLPHHLTTTSARTFPSPSGLRHGAAHTISIRSPKGPRSPTSQTGESASAWPPFPTPSHPTPCSRR